MSILFGIKHIHNLNIGHLSSHNNKLKWDQHINNITGAANRMLGFLARTMRKCPRQLKEKAYKTCVRPKLEYCSTIWDPHQQKYIDKV